MDDFLTPAEQDLRRRARERFRPPRDPAAGDADSGFGPGGVEKVSKELGFSGRGLLERALVVEEAAAASSEAARALVGSAADGADAAALELAWNLGAASAALEAGLAAARDRGLFQSALMGHQKVQGQLADVLSAVQALRLKAYRALRLVDAGRTERGAEELGRAAAEAAAVRTLALALAGAGPGAPGPSGTRPGNERSGP